MTEAEVAGWDLVLGDVRIGPWPKRQAENLAYHQRLWCKTINDPCRVTVEPHDPGYAPSPEARDVQQHWGKQAS